MTDTARCESTFTFSGMQTVFECQNPPDQPVPGQRRPTWSHLHGRWHYFEDVDGDGQRFRVEWEDTPAADDAEDWEATERWEDQRD